MRLVRVDFDAKEAPSVFTVSLTLDELALLYRLTGHIAPKRITDLSGDVRWGDALYELADGAGGFLNRFFDAGPDDVIPRFDVYKPDQVGEPG